jgi:uncharacterized Zn-finger protein
MTERSNFGYPPPNMGYPPAAQWSDIGQQPPQYPSPVPYYSPSYSSQGSRSVNVPYVGTRPQDRGPMGQNAHHTSYSQNANPAPQIPMQQQQIYTHPAPQPQPRLPSTHNRSHSMQAYPPQSSSHPPIMTPPHSPSQYHSQMPYGQTMGNGGNGMQYPASPNRPFSCDMCALSFNRQHDLKRHRETHSGEKPFLCNGGCGKTFTRKDALKRHQLVKQCGHDDES